MSECGRLFRAENVYAYYSAAEKHVVVLADVVLNPTADRVHVCPNPIAPPVGPREFLVEGTTKPGIHPQLAVVRRVSFAYPADATPKSVIVYSMGIDAPSKREVDVSSAPPPPLEAATKAVAASKPSSASPPSGPIEATGYSATFSFEEALQDALAQATARFPSPPRNPDVAIAIEVKHISARAGGNIRPGLFVQVVAKP